MGLSDTIPAIALGTHMKESQLFSPLPRWEMGGFRKWRNRKARREIRQSNPEHHQLFSCFQAHYLSWHSKNMWDVTLANSDPGEPGGLLWRACPPTSQTAHHSWRAEGKPHRRYVAEAASHGIHTPWSYELNKSYRIEDLSADLQPTLKPYHQGGRAACGTVRVQSNFRNCYCLMIRGRQWRVVQAAWVCTWDIWPEFLVPGFNTLQTLSFEELSSGKKIFLSLFLWNSDLQINL